MDSKSAVLASLGNNYIQVHEFVLKNLKGDCTTAVILSKLIAFYQYNESKGGLDQGWFPFNSTYITKTIGINEYHQRKSLEMLEAGKYISIDFQGFPKRRFIHLNFNKIVNLLEGTVTKKTMPKNKQDFYADINRAMGLPLREARTYSGNINKEIFDLMYGWTYTVKIEMGEEWVWNPKDYGVLKNHFLTCYSYKPYNYSKLQKIARALIAQGKGREHITMADFVKQDNLISDDPFSTPLSIENYI